MYFSLFEHFVEVLLQSDNLGLSGRGTHDRLDPQLTMFEDILFGGDDEGKELFSPHFFGDLFIFTLL